MATQFYCRSEQRRSLVRETVGGDGNPLLNGIDYLEVSPDQTTLYVHFIHNLPGETDGVPDSPVLAAMNVDVEGGVRIQRIRVTTTATADDVLTVDVDTPGDFSTYTLRLVAMSSGDDPPAGYDPQLSQVEFSFKADCPEEFDCLPDECPPEEMGAEPNIDYLAKDYASFKRLMLDRLSVVVPDWEDRNAADLGMAVVEAVAYTGDYLSYYQDAVSTEAYLGTARCRISVRRHARLLDYRMHEGCNSRTWVHVQAQGSSNGRLDAPVQLLTKVEGHPAVVNEGSLAYDQIMAESPAVFESLHDAFLRESHNEVRFYTWGEEECCLPKGATKATLRDVENNRLLLRPGDVLIFEEVQGPSESEQPDPAHRHAVRLTKVSPDATPLPDGDRAAGTMATDPLTGDAVVEIEWDTEDALPFPVCISTDTVEDVSVVRGNVVLASHGRTVWVDESEQEREQIEVPHREGALASLSEPNLTHSVAYDHDSASIEPAAGVLVQEPRDALPEVALAPDDSPETSWEAQRDLLNSGRSAAEFVVETSDDGVSHLRFGDGVMGRKPSGGTTFRADYRVGNGRSANVGADAVYHIVTGDASVVGVRNPLSAQGGIDPEQIEEVRLYAPQAFRTQQRAVTEEDYAEVAERHSDVQTAVATRLWTGSWHTMFITVDRKEGRAVDADFEEELREFITTYRMAGHDLEIEPPVFVPPEVEMDVCVVPEYLQSTVKEALLETFSSGVGASGTMGFWHPDNFTFGGAVYLSQLVAAAQAVPGVMWVDIKRFQRWGKPDFGELAGGRIPMQRLEIAQLDNDPSRPENGKMTFEMEGGL